MTHPLTPAESKAVTHSDEQVGASRRMLARFPLWRQVNPIDSGDAEAMYEIDGVRAAANTQEGQYPIVADYRDDRHWPQLGTST